MRRILAGSTAFLALTGLLLVLPVYAAPLPEAEPVTTSTEALELGSVVEPAPEAEVQAGTTDPVAGVPDTAPALTLAETDTEKFSLVGVTWAYDPAVTDTVVQVRVQDAGGEWGTWTEVTVEDADQDESADSGAVLRGGTAPLWTGPSTGVEVELVTRSGAQPTDVVLDLVDPGESPADTALGTPEVDGTAHAAAALPPVYSRAQWGADEGIRTWGPEYAATIRAATLHHTADTNNYTADQVPAMMRSIYRYHTVSRGWGDIGYNVIADRYGRLWEGRYGGLASTVIGAHSGGFNTGTFGVSMLGNYDVAPTTPAMVDAVAAVIAWKLGLYGVDPRGTVTLTSSGGGTSRYAAGQKVTLPTVFGHRQVGSTSCPGQYGYAQLATIRDRAAALGAVAPVQPIAARYAGDAGLRTSLGAPVGAQQTEHGVTWQAYQRGRLFSAPGAGVHALWGGVLERYLALGGPGTFGAPTTDETPTPDRLGVYNHFTRGASIYWTAQTGAQPVWGAIRHEWSRVRWESGPLGYPVGPEVTTPNGVSQAFQRGQIVFSLATGAHEVRGGILRRWLALGGLSAGLLPVTGETAVAGGAVSTFTRGTSIVWSPGGGTRVVWGAIGEEWARTGGAAGLLGLPLKDETGSGQAVTQPFAGGTVVWTAATGAHEVHGLIGQVWTSLGGIAAGLVPTTPETPTPDGVGRYSHFANGVSIYWSPTTGAWSVMGAIRAHWSQLGWEAGPLGYPVTHEQTVAPGVRRSTFGGGEVYWSPATGAQAVYGSIGVTYRSLGAHASRLGLPTRSEYGIVGGRRADFRGGSITWTPTGGTVVRYR